MRLLNRKSAQNFDGLFSPGLAIRSLKVPYQPQKWPNRTKKGSKKGKYVLGGFKRLCMLLKINDLKKKDEGHHRLSFDTSYIDL